MSIVSGTIAAINQRKSAKEQNNITAQQNANQLQLELASRGAPLTGAGIPEELRGRQSAILPFYFGDTEKNLSTNAAGIYDAIRKRTGSPELQLADYSALLGKYDASANAADKLGEDLVSGRLTDQSLEESQPVFAARRGVAEARRNAGLEALKATLNEIDGIQAGKGYSGDSTGKRMLRFDARRQIGTHSASDLAGANLENASEERAIRESGRDRRLSNLNLPAALAKSAITRKQAPELAVEEGYQNSLSPFGFFNIGPNKFQKADSLSALPNTAGDIANAFGQTGAAVGSSLMKYYSNKSLGDQARVNSFKSSGRAPSNFNSFTPSQQSDYSSRVQAADNWIAANPQEYASYQ